MMGSATDRVLLPFDFGDVSITRKYRISDIIMRSHFFTVSYYTVGFKHIAGRQRKGR